MTTQVLPLLDPARGVFWAWFLPTAVITIVALAALVDYLLEQFRAPAGVLAVYSPGSARRALARVNRLDLESTASGAAAYRHLMSVKTWATSERHYGSQRRRAAVSALLADALAQLRALGHDPDGLRIVEPRDGILASPGRYAESRAAGAPLLNVLSRTDATIWYVDRH